MNLGFLSYPNPPFWVVFEIMDPIPTWYHSIWNFVNILLFYLCFKKTHETYIIQLQEDFDIILVIWLIKALDVLAP